MDIIDWGAVDRDGMPAFKAALRALEIYQIALQAEYSREAAALYAQTVRLTDRLDYLDARRKDERQIRAEIDGRLRVVEEQVANMAAALTELTAPKCAVCYGKNATTGPDGKLCAECVADAQAGIEDTGLAEMRVRPPVRYTYPRKGRGAGIGTYCERCGTVILHNAGEYTLAACEYCGHPHLNAITSVRDDRRDLPVMPFAAAPRITRAAVASAFGGNGHE